MRLCLKCFLFLVFSFSQWLSSSEIHYGIGAKKEGTIPITRVQFFGERCCGTNYLQSLILKNFSFEFPYFSFGWKHFPLWLDESWLKKRLPENKKNYFLQDSEPFLFIVIFRDPYDWLQSFNQKPYHTSTQFRKAVAKDFSKFIRTPWEAEDRLMYIESNPKDGSKFENVMKLRTARTRNMLAIGSVVKNIYYVNYEVVRDYPEQVIEEISAFFGIPRIGPFVPVLEQYKASHTTGDLFKVKEYPEIKREDLLYINKYLDPKLEERIGYVLKR
jgi:hypothetical protein